MSKAKRVLAILAVLGVLPTQIAHTEKKAPPDTEAIRYLLFVASQGKWPTDSYITSACVQPNFQSQRSQQWRAKFAGYAALLSQPTLADCKNGDTTGKLCATIDSFLPTEKPGADQISLVPLIVKRTGLC